MEIPIYIYTDTEKLISSDVFKLIIQTDLVAVSINDDIVLGKIENAGYLKQTGADRSYGAQSLTAF